MSITVSGLGSGLDYDSWIKELVAIKQADIDAVSSNVKFVTKQESTLSTVQEDYENFLKAVQTFTDALSTNDVFNSKVVTSSSDAIKATVTSKATIQDVSVTVSQLATGTEAKSTYPVASYATPTTKLGEISNGSFKEGSFTIYVDGQANKINLTSNNTLQDVLNTIGTTTGTGWAGVTATLSDKGILNITNDGTHTVTVGSTSDTSNFSKLMSLTKTAANTYESSKSIFDTNTTTAIKDTTFSTSTGSDIQVGTGNFYINDTEFTIGASTSLDDIINTINSSKAGVNAVWNSNTGTLSLTADEEGAINIDIEAGSSNFTNVMGLTQGGAIIPEAQTLGTNAIFTVNGTTITSSSNTVGSEVTGIKGLTLELNSTTSTTNKISVAQDTTAITNALNSLVNAFNTVIKDTDDATGTDGYLYGESILNSVRNKMRKLITSAVEGEDGYKTLSSIGISTGAIGTSVKSDTNKLTIDSQKLADVLAKDPNAVKTLLVGDDNSKGVLTDIETILDGFTNAANGYFVTKDKSYEDQIKRLNNKIDKMDSNLEDYQKKLNAKFSAMDQLISAMQKSASIFDSYFNNKNKNS